jgi:hypothetical protein
MKGAIYARPTVSTKGEGHQREKRDQAPRQHATTSPLRNNWYYIKKFAVELWHIDLPLRSALDPHTATCPQNSH